MNPAAMLAIALAQNSKSSGSGGKPPQKENGNTILGYVVIGALVLLFFAIIGIHLQEEKVNSYTVHGSLVGYVDVLDGKARHTFVRILQSDGVIRSYNTYIHPDQCVIHVTGIDVPVRVDVYRNKWFPSMRSVHSEMVGNPCL